MNPITIIYIIIVGISFFSSLVSFRLDFPLHLKIFSVLLGLTFIVELSSVLVPWLFHIKNNIPLYNSFTLIEFWVYGYYFRMIIDTTWVKKAITVFLCLFPLFWFITVFFVFGFTQWNSYVMIVGAFFTVSFAIAYYYQLLTSDIVVNISKHPEYWIATGMLILYSCQLPYFGMFNFLLKHYLLLTRNLLTVITFLNILMYSLFTYAYLCRTTNIKKY